MTTPQQAVDHFVQAWISAWNAHDLESILSHYSDDIQFTSPFVSNLAGIPSGTIQGKENLRAYFEKALASYPDLKFTWIKTLAGMNSLTIYYESVGKLLAAEVMLLNQDGKIQMVLAHYAAP